MAAIRATLARCWVPQSFPETEGYRCDLREVGPLGFSLPWSGGGGSTRVAPAVPYREDAVTTFTASIGQALRSFTVW